MYVLKVYSIYYTLRYNTTVKKNLTLDKMNGSKNALIFLLRAPTNHSFSFNLGFLDEVKHKVCLSKTVCGTFNF